MPKFNIKTLNKITKQGLDIFDGSKYEIDGDNDADAFIVRSANLLDMGFENKSLKAIARAGAGFNNIPVDKCAERGIVVFNTPGANANAVKELAVAAILLASRDIVGGINWARTLEQDVAKSVEAGKSNYVGPEVYGKTLGIIGLGAIGTMTANAGVALGMDVLGYDPYMTIEAAMALSRSVRRAYDRPTLYEASDYIVLHAPVTGETKGMINRESISAMKKGVVIINLSRADLVNDADMAEALESGAVAKYVTDFPNEAVMKMKNAIPIPHLGASTPESEDNCAFMAVNQIIDFLENGNIKNSVNYPNLSMPKGGENRICVMHKNVPNMISQITSAVSEAGINIEHLANSSRGDYAYTICEVNGELPSALVKKIEEIGDIIRVNVIKITV